MKTLVESQKLQDLTFLSRKLQYSALQKHYHPVVQNRFASLGEVGQYMKLVRYRRVTVCATSETIQLLTKHRNFFHRSKVFIVWQVWWGILHSWYDLHQVTERSLKPRRKDGCVGKCIFPPVSGNLFVLCPSTTITTGTRSWGVITQFFFSNYNLSSSALHRFSSKWEYN